jgi:hypothetical protein
MPLWVPADFSLRQGEIRTMWGPRIGREATRLRLRSRTALRFGAGGALCSLLFWSLALVAADHATSWTFGVVTSGVLGLGGLLSCCVGLPLSGRFDRRAQHAANEFWGMPDTYRVPYDDVRRFDRWHARHLRHPELMPTPREGSEHGE